MFLFLRQDCNIDIVGYVMKTQINSIINVAIDPNDHPKVVGLIKYIVSKFSPSFQVLKTDLLPFL